ncbi:MAG: hypothetical protein IPM17_03540 [Verrucomicrobia bacterium]|nr:hypothetical protein [Verrucomicrobiota bacterium]
MKTGILGLSDTARRRPLRPAGFTLCELLVILATLGLLMALLLPNLVRASGTGPDASCLDNLRRLGQAWLLYSTDYQTYLPPNPDSGSSAPGTTWVPGSAGVRGAHEFNPDLLRNTNYSLAPYLGGETTVFHCPADLRSGRYQGTDPALIGTIVPAARSYSMNGAVGTNPSQLRGKAPVDGAWLDGTHTHVANSRWYTYGRTVDLIEPGPANTFVLLDEAPASLNDGHFACVGPSANQTYRMIDWPATYHGGGAGILFADGHAEIHLWQDPRTTLKGFPSSQNQPNNPDIAWLANHASALITAPVMVRPGLNAEGQFAVTASTRRNTRYVLERAEALEDALWQEVASLRSTNGGAMVFTDHTAPAARGFYRVRVP